MTMLAAALKLAERGFAVFQVMPHDKVPVMNGGFKNATRNPKVIEDWWRSWSNCNVGIACGAPSSVFVVDVDVKGDGEKSIRQLESEHGELPPTVESVTPSGGRHLFFRYPGFEVGCSVGKIASGVDIRGTGGYVVAPPSIGKNVRRYYWSVDSAGAFADAPVWLLDMIRATAAPAGTNGAAARIPPSEWRALAGDEIPEGKRNVTIAKMSGHLLRRYVDPHLVLELLQSWNATRCVPPLPVEEVTVIVDSICRKELGRRAANGQHRKAG
jgi:hypothetical protein